MIIRTNSNLLTKIFTIFYFKLKNSDLLNNYLYKFRPDNQYLTFKPNFREILTLKPKVWQFFTLKLKNVDLYDDNLDKFKSDNQYLTLKPNFREIWPQNQSWTIFYFKTEKCWPLWR